MPDIEERYDCPVCLGTKMEKLKIKGNNTLLLDFCRRCGGIWFDHGEVRQLRNFQSNVLINKINPDKEAFKMQCHSCHCFISRNAFKCARCGWRNVIECPVCAETMKRKTISNLHLDYCQSCKGVWFDNIELSEIWNGQLNIHAKKSPEKSIIDSDAASFFIEILAYDPGLVVYGAEASIEVGKAVVETSANIISNSPEIAGAFIEGVGEVAGAVFEVIAEIIAGIFSDL